MPEKCKECQKDQEPGVRCPYCGARYEALQPDAARVMREWDRLMAIAGNREVSNRVM